MDHPIALPRIDVAEILRQYGLRPDKSLGQNFLVDESILWNITQAARIAPDDTVLEIGAGLGSLTRYLALNARSVIAVELDSRLIPPLNQVTAQHLNVRVIEGDILSLDPGQLISSPGYLIVANIPYYITSALIRHLLEAKIPPRRMLLTIQQEVARRICASPGEMSLLALSVQVYGQPTPKLHVPSAAFYPSPKVDSEVIQIELYSTPQIAPPLLNDFFVLIKAGFSQKRKMLRNALSGGLHLPPPIVESLLLEAAIDPHRRAETLSLDEWKPLTELYHNSNYAKVA